MTSGNSSPRHRGHGAAFAGALLIAAAACAGSASANQNGVAVIIGNQAYDNRDIPAVRFAHRDAEAFKRYVTDILGFRKENIIDLRDATKAKMEATFGNDRSFRGRLFQFVRPGRSDVVVFYSGHGVPGVRDKRGYLLPSDAEPSAAEINGFPVDLLYANLTKLQARSTTVFLDACFSGNSPEGMLIKDASPVFVKVKQPEQQRDLTVLTAASGDQLASWDRKAEHGLFTEHLMRALYGRADQKPWGNGDGLVALREIKAYLDDEMTYAARRNYNRDQTATVTGPRHAVLSAYPPGKPPRRPTLDDAEINTAALSPATVTLEPINAPYIVVKNANVRELPRQGARKVRILLRGAKVHVPGKVKGSEWLAVEKDGEALGYVYAPLLAALTEIAPRNPQPIQPDTPATGTTNTAKPAPSGGTQSDTTTPTAASPEPPSPQEMRLMKQAARLALQAGDIATARKHLEPLANAGDAYSQFALGMMYVRGKGVPIDLVQAVRWLKLAAQQGHAEAEDILNRLSVD